MGLNHKAWPSSRWARRVLRSTISCLAVFSALILAASSARAGNEEFEREAKRACLAGEYAKGVSALADLYVKTNNPVYIFNQGRCFEQSGKYEEAIIRFREYQVKLQNARRRSDPQAEEHITTCQGLLDAQREKEKALPPVTPPPPVAPVPSSPLPATPAPAVEAPTAPTQIDVTQPATAPANSHLRIAGIAALAVGAVGITTGIILNVKANSLSKKIDDKLTYASDVPSLQDKRDRYETWGWVGYGVGGACLVGGAVMTWLAYRQDGDSQVAFVPSVGPGLVGAAVQGAF
jgi:hypothetical protein